MYKEHDAMTTQVLLRDKMTENH